MTEDRCPKHPWIVLPCVLCASAYPNLSDRAAVTYPGLSDRAVELRVRRRLARKGQRLNRWTASIEYGPYMITDATTNGLVASGISDLREVLADLDAVALREQQEGQS